MLLLPQFLSVLAFQSCRDATWIRREQAAGFALSAENNQDTIFDRDTSATCSSVDCTRTSFLQNCAFALIAGSAAIISSPTSADAKSYSENAKNLERINGGDFSGGAVYSNNPSTDAGKRRRAMTGCKTPIAREEAAETVLKQKSLSEKECNTMVLGGDNEFMLQALRNLDCPTCPYGISSSRR